MDSSRDKAYEQKANLKGNYTKSELEKRRLIHPGMRDGKALNAFRRLRSSLLGKLEKFNCCVMVSAANVGGGASFVASNLAIAFAMDEQKHSLLVDCNFSQHSQSKTFGVDSETGLYDYLNGFEASAENIIHRTLVPRVSMVPAGKPESEDQIEYFTSKKMKDFFK